MPTEREEKLAAARKKLARFQQTKSSGGTPTPSVQPKQESISRSPASSASPKTHVNTKVDSDSLSNGLNIPYSNPTPTYQSIQTSPQQQASLNAIQLAELEASKIQLRDHQQEITNLQQQLQRGTQINEQLESDIVAMRDEVSNLKERNNELVFNIEQLNAHSLKVEAAKNDEINQLRSTLTQSEQVSQQLNVQLQTLQQQIDDYKKQVSIHDHQSVSNQHQLHNRIQQQDNAIHILVEEKGELLGQIKALEEFQVTNKMDVDNKRHENKQLEDSLSQVRTELKTFKDYFDQNEAKKIEQEEKLKTTIQNFNRIRQENEILKRRDEEKKFMIEQLQDQLKQSYNQINEINERKNMAEASLSQLSCGSEAIVVERNQLLEKLQEIQVRYDQIRSQLDELKLERDNLQHSNHATSIKFQKAIDDMNSQIVKLNTENQNLLALIEQNKQNEISITAKEDIELDELNQQLSSQAQTLFELQDRLKLETGAREQCELKIQDMRNEKQELEAQIVSNYETLDTFKRRCAELEECQVQTKILLESSQSDKSTISRVMQQNEKLKHEFEELQIQLGRVTNEKADLTVRVGSLEHSLNNSRQQIEDHEDVKLDKDQWRRRLEEHEQAIHNLKSDLEISQREAKNLLEQNTELQQALILARDHLKQQHSAMQATSVSDESSEVNFESESMSMRCIEKQKEILDTAPESLSEPKILQSDDEERKSSNSSSYSIVDYEADRSSTSDHAQAESLTGDTFNQTNVSNIPSNYEEDARLVNATSRISELEQERDILTGQLVEAKQKQLELLNRVGGMKETRPEQEDYEALKAAKVALEQKFVEIIGQNASIKDENEKLEALVLQLNAETDTIIEYVALYRDQRASLVQKEKQREEEIRTLSVSKSEIQERVSELELLLKSTVQNIKGPPKKQKLRKISTEQEETAADQDAEKQDDNSEDNAEEFELIEALEEGVQKQQLDKIMDLLEEIKDPLAGQNAPAMIGLEYIGELHTI